MQPQVALIGQSEFDWTTYLTACKTALGRNVTRILDNRRIEVKTPTGFIGTLSELNAQDSVNFLEDTSLLRHVSFSFLVFTDRDTLTELLMKSTQSIAVEHTQTLQRDVHLSVISGNLQQWLTATVACCSGRESTELRFLFDTVILHFEKKGLADIFKKWRKITLPDSTFKLIPK